MLGAAKSAFADLLSEKDEYFLQVQYPKYGMIKLMEEEIIGAAEIQGIVFYFPGKRNQYVKIM